MSAAAPLVLPRAGTVVGGRFRLSGVVRRSPLVVAFEAADGTGGSTALVECVAPRRLADAAARARLARAAAEAASLAERLGASRFPRVVASGDDAGVPWVAFEPPAGAPLAHRLATDAAPVGERTASAWLDALAASLDALHAAGRRHLEVGAQAVWVADDGRAWLSLPWSATADVGGVLDAAADPTEVAPETIAGATADAAADRYALAALVRRALVSRTPPPRGLDRLAGPAGAAFGASDPTPTPPGLSASAAAALRHALAPRPEARPADATSFARAFRAGLEAAVPRAAAGAGRTAPRAPAPTAGTRARRTGPRGRPSRGLVWGFVAGAIGAWSSMPPPPPRAPATLVVTSPAPGTEVSAEGFTVTGTVRGAVAGDELAVNGRAAWIRADGSFSTPVATAAGAAGVVVTLRAGNAFVAPTQVVPVWVGPRPKVEVEETGSIAASEVSAEQRACAAALGVPVAFEDAFGMTFVLVPPGAFVMGSPYASPQHREDEDPHLVVLTRPFYLQTTETTTGHVAAWAARTPRAAAEVDGGLPVVRMDDRAARDLLRWLDASVGASGADADAVYRLPTEAEWEYACRAGDGPSAASTPERASGTRTGSLVPAASLRANGWGLRGMLGNASERVADAYGPYARHRVADPMVGLPPPDEAAARGRRGVMRGGSAVDPPASRRAERRWTDVAPSLSGLRLATGVPPPRAERRVAIAARSPAAGTRVPAGEVRLELAVRGARSDDVVRVGGATVAPPAAGVVVTAVRVAEGPNDVVAVVADRRGREVARAVVRLVGFPPRGGSTPAWAELSDVQVAAARRLGVPAAFENSVGLRFVLVPAGTFRMGDPRSRDAPPREVTLTRPYYVGVSEVTDAAWRRWRPDAPRPGDDEQDGALPRVRVDAASAEAFAQWLTTSERRATRYRLPTEAEWEHAARAGTTTRWWWGDDDARASAFGNVGDDARAPRPAATCPPNPWGLYDVVGNVSELCADAFGPWTTAAATDPFARGTPSVRRGGDLRSATADTAHGLRTRASVADASSGLRLVLDVEPTPAAALGAVAIEAPRGGTEVPAGPTTVRGSVRGGHAADGVWVAGVAATRSGDRFEVTVEVPEGAHDLVPELRDAAGRVARGPAVRVTGRAAKPAPTTASAPPAAPLPTAEAFLAGWATPVGSEVDPTTKLPRRIRRTADGMEMVLVPAGTFPMGAVPGDLAAYPDERPRRRVRLTRPYYLDEHEVTVGMWDRFTARARPAATARPPSFRDRLPVVDVAWRQVQEYLRWARVELPTEAQWERAARGGHDDFVYPWGAEDALSRRNAAGGDDGHAGLAAVKSYPPNAYGLHDMAGNALEWCADAYASYPAAPGETVDPMGPSTSAETTPRVARGGSFGERPTGTRASMRRALDTGVLPPGIVGFRCAKTVR